MKLVIDLFSLGVSVALGIPISNWINKNMFDEEYKEVKKVVKKLDYLFTEKKIYNLEGNKPKIKDIKVTNYGYLISLDIQGITSYTELEKVQDYIKSLFKAYYIELISSKGNIVKLDIITKNLIIKL